MGQRKQIGNHCTTVSTKDGVTNVTYHRTIVVRFNDNAIMLDTGGYFTSTTKTRMNQASNQFDLGYSVYQKKGDWFCNYQDKTYSFDGSELVLSRQPMTTERIQSVVSKLFANTLN